MNKKFFDVDICGRVERLPVLTFANGIGIAFFNLHGNVGLTEHCAKNMTPMFENIDVLMTVESKGLQLTHCLARNLGHDRYAVVRKTSKLYMQDGIVVQYKSITTDGIQNFYLSSEDVALIAGKKVALVDDVVSTGGSLQALSNLACKADAQVAKKCCVLAEGEAAKRKDICFLATIPLF
ncbi:MAG: adenine phosphoribosyltransferase [Clostridiales bacterium]|jgi:adenine phosphoribosyltransferase|nr:adenine phosphoribosyltransferase [Clostridiales bacterium]